MTSGSLQNMLSIGGMVLLLSGCVTATVDEMVFNEPTEGIGDATVVILGRRHISDHYTEPDFVRCVAKHVARKDNSIVILGELEFVNLLYPWFEPRTAPLRPVDLKKLLQHPPVARIMAELNTAYMIWINGSTERTDATGTMSCAIGPGGGGCFGFMHWSDESDYEAVIWDFTDQAEVGRVSATASGQSYMPAVIIPIPIIAPVQGTACNGIGDQLLEFLSGKY